MKQRHARRLLLIMRDQGVHPSQILSNPAMHPGERLWGYRPLCELLGLHRVDIQYVGRGESFGLVPKLTTHLAARVLGDMRIRLDLLRKLHAGRAELEAVLVTDNSAIFTTLLTRHSIAVSYRVYPLLLGWVEFKFPQMPAWKRRIWLSLLREADGVLALGIEEAEQLRRLGLENVRFLHLGVDTEFWSPGNGARGDFVFSVGADPCRDYETLVEAVQDLPTVLCAPPWLVRGLRLRDNIKLVQGDQLDVRRWLRQARIVVIPIKDVLRPSGQSCILQAMSTGKAVITTRTRGRWSELLVNDENCILVPPCDVDTLRVAIMNLYDDERRIMTVGQRARQTVLEHFSVKHFAHSIALNTEMLA